jgi:molybdate transport system regulatory protein
MIRSVKQLRKTTVRPRVKLWLEAGDGQVICHGLSDMLKAIDETGSIKGAAARIGRSYRFVWARIKDAEQSIGELLVEAHVGGRGTQRSELTPLARDLIRDFEQFRQEVFHLVDNVFGQRLEATLRQHR